LVGSKENSLALLENEQIKGVITNSISELNDRKRRVLKLYTVEELNLKKIGSVIGVKESRASQILSSIVKELHDTVAKKYRILFARLKTNHLQLLK
jgi:RNA polymerase sigma factor for flagellar operon FliA